MQTMQAAETTKVIYGVNELELDLAGKTVREIWKALEQVFNIPRDAVVTVNGSQADDEYVVHPGDEIECGKGDGRQRDAQLPLGGHRARQRPLQRGLPRRGPQRGPQPQLVPRPGRRAVGGVWSQQVH